MYKETIVHGTVGHGDFYSRSFLQVKGLLNSTGAEVVIQPPTQTSHPATILGSIPINIAYYHSYYYAVANLMYLDVASMSVKSHNLSE